MFWADRIAGEIREKYGLTKSILPLVIRDEKTISGRVHVGSMRGVAIHGAVAEELAQSGVENTFLYELNDFDVFDSIPEYLPAEEFKKYLGMLLMNVPAPAGSAAKNFAEHFGSEFCNVIKASGFAPEFYWGSELYLSGKMDGVIREALLGADTIRRIYKEVSGSQKEGEWLPISVICPRCEKIATTEADNFSAEAGVVFIRCREKRAEWTVGCGFEGNVSPFGGKAKLPWKVEWPAKWKVMGVSVEGGGKDHSTKGGARDVANHIAREVFHYEPPFDVPYEFFLVGGKKMSSSKGQGSSAREIADLVPSKIFRLALLGRDINQAVNFNPEGDTIPALYDWYDKLAESYRVGVKDDYARLFEFLTAPKVLSQKSSGRLGAESSAVGFQNFAHQLPPLAAFSPRFSQVAFLVQQLHLDLEKEMEKIKGIALTAEDKQELAERAAYAKKWLAEYAPEKFVFKLQDTLPDAARDLSVLQKNALREIAGFIKVSNTMPSGEEMHQKLHSIKDELKIAPADLFGALYLIFFGKPYGPKAGWFLSVLDKEFVLRRLQEAMA